MTSHSDHRIAVDIGGTFTDTVLIRGSEVLTSTKTLTTHDAPADGAIAGVKIVLAETGVTPSDIRGVIHGATLATNALIERRGARVACVLTEGFRDILEIAYERRHSQYDINIDKPDLIVPRSRCFTVPERVSVGGEVLVPLDETAIHGLIAELDASEAEAVAICLLHAYANPAHERRLAELIHAQRPNLAISLSSEVSPEAREFDRLCTTLANAYVQPLMSTYLAAFARDFAAMGITAPILMMTAGGGMTTLETAARYPIRLVESGPAGGAVLAAKVAEQCELSEVLSFDMGGTTAKLCLIDNYQPQTARRFEIARAERFIKGSGMPVRIPVVEMIEIGVGGGSIAAVDRLGRLTVGPESAGSEPGPVGFGRGGDRPTVTDADLAQGLIDPAGFAEGRLSVDPEASATVLARDIGTALGLDADGAAHGVSEIVDEAMASAARMHAVESGKDLSARTMIAFGGNGSLHATRVARRASVTEIVVPPDPGVGSAVGFLFAPVSFEIVRSRYMTLEAPDLPALAALFVEMSAEATNVVRQGARDATLTETRTAFMRYRGQGHEIEITLPNGPVTTETLTALRAGFEAEYARQFTRTVPGMTVEILNWAIRVTTAGEPAGMGAPARGDSERMERRVICEITGQPVTAKLIPRASITSDEIIAGPALITEPQTTTFVSSDFTARTDTHGNLRLTRQTGDAK
ncbi:MAG: hydantoinase/oxoprolinase family protein [Pikeienuella sp.]